MEKEVDKLIIDWIKSDNENTTYLVYQICILFDELNKKNKQSIAGLYRCCGTFDCGYRDNKTWMCNKNTNCISQIKK